MADQDQKASAAERDQCRSVSRSCPRCSGEGQCEVFHPAYDGRRSVRAGDTSRGRPVVRTCIMVTSAHCLCEMGRFIRRNTDPDMLRRIVDLADVVAGASIYVADDPTGLTPGPWFQGLPIREDKGGAQLIPKEESHA